ncbi:MAG: hypothetical protein Q7J24_16775, partial [Desulfomicrobium sp.]|nr:hypothetical protein [Desulfomicrobium sp.]
LRQGTTGCGQASGKGQAEILPTVRAGIAGIKFGLRKVWISFPHGSAKNNLPGLRRRHHAHAPCVPWV